MLTLNRPELLNAINRAMLREIQTAVAQVNSEGALGALIVRGAGRAFSSGFDLKEQLNQRGQGTPDWRQILTEDFAATLCVWTSEIPTIAAVHGSCLAGAFELALCCDITIASEDAMFGEPELKFGAGIVTMILAWIVGPKRAKEIILLGADRISAIEAERIGLINRVVPKGQHFEAALKMAQNIAALDGRLVRHTKGAINRTLEIMGLNEALQACLEIDVRIESEGSPDKKKFFDIAREKGFRSAFDWRDSRFS